MKVKLALATLVLLSGCATSLRPPVAPMSLQELTNYKIDCDRKEQQLTFLNQQRLAYDLPKDLARMSDNQRMVNGQIKSKVWAIRLECK